MRLPGIVVAGTEINECQAAAPTLSTRVNTNTSHNEGPCDPFISGMLIHLFRFQGECLLVNDVKNVHNVATVCCYGKAYMKRQFATFDSIDLIDVEGFVNDKSFFGDTKQEMPEERELFVDDLRHCNASKWHFLTVRLSLDSLDNLSPDRLGAQWM